MVQLLKDGAVTQEYAYDAYGYINADEFGIQAPFYGYNGEEQNPFTGLQYLRARYYAPQNGGFITQDSFSGVLTNALSQNRYTYAHNNPVNYADPSGHSIWDSIKNGVTNAVNSVKNFVSNVANKVSSAVSSAVNAVKSAVTGTTTKTVANTSSAVKKSYTNTAVRQKIGSYAGGAAAAAGSVTTRYSNSVVNGVVADSRIPFTNAAGQTISVPSHFSNLAEAAKDFVRRVCDAEMQRIETQRAVEQAQQKILSDTVHSAGNAISAFYKAWNANANYWHDYYNNATNVGDFLYGGVNYFTYGLIDGINKSYQQRHQEMLDDFTLYNIANWGLSGIPDRVKGAIAPEDPLSLQHWLDSFSVVMIGYGLYQGYQFANAPANTINTAHPVTGTGMLDDFAEGSVATQAKEWQLANGGYGVADDWMEIQLKKGDIVWGGTSGQSNFYTTNEVAELVGTDATKLYQGLQVGKGAFPTYRAGFTMYEVKEDITVAYSQALANSHISSGGFEQYFIPNFENVLTPIQTVLMNNR